MILYSQSTSPYSAAVRIAVYAKNLNIDIIDPPGGLGSTRFHSINALGTIPCLVDGELVLPESVAILEYLEEIHPSPALLPRVPRERAAVRLVQRIAELGILNPSVELAKAPPSNEGATGSAKLTRLLRGLASADAYVSEPPFAVGGSLSLADCQLSIALSLVRKLATQSLIPDLLSSRPRLARYLDIIQDNQHVSRVLSEMEAAS